MIPYIRTKTGISFVLSGVPYHVATTDGHFQDVVSIIDSPWLQDGEDQIRNILERATKALKNISQLSPRLSYDGAALFFNGEALHNYAADRIIDALVAGQDVDPVVNFLEKLLDNPSNQVIVHLYQFLEHGKIPLTQDGDFLVYKAIRSDWKDIHSGTMSNRVGNTVKMPRGNVDDRRDVTCSHGLHVCSYEYLPNFAHANGHVVICKVNPANVVAIPNDYNDTKMRVSEYTVIGVVDDYYKRGENILASQPYFSVGDVSADDPDSDYQGEGDPEDAVLEEKDTYGIFIRRLGEAESSWEKDVEGFKNAHNEAGALFYGSDDDISAVAIRNMATGELMFTWGIWTR